MNTNPFEGCCCSTVLSMFGGSENADYVVEALRFHNASQVVAAILKAAENACIMGDARVVIISNDEQILLNEALLVLQRDAGKGNIIKDVSSLGWRHSKKHDTLTKVWELSLQKLPTDELLKEMGLD